VGYRYRNQTRKCLNHGIGIFSGITMNKLKDYWHMGTDSKKEGSLTETSNRLLKAS
jgi:hypothetical protein